MAHRFEWRCPAVWYTNESKETRARAAAAPVQYKLSIDEYRTFENYNRPTHTHTWIENKAAISYIMNIYIYI